MVSNMAKHDPDLSRIFHALGDPTRRALLARIGSGAVPVSVLAEPTGFSLPTILRHLDVLEEAGLIATQKQGRTRLCRSRPETLGAALDWLSAQRAEWEARLDRFDDYVMTLQKDGADGP
jgi:DNA-binding transcriptional ArsR family regulator